MFNYSPCPLLLYFSYYVQNPKILTILVSDREELKVGLHSSSLDLFVPKPEKKCYNSLILLIRLIKCDVLFTMQCNCKEIFKDVIKVYAFITFSGVIVCFNLVLQGKRMWLQQRQKFHLKQAQTKRVKRMWLQQRQKFLLTHFTVF